MSHLALFPVQLSSGLQQDSASCVADRKKHAQARSPVSVRFLKHIAGIRLLSTPEDNLPKPYSSTAVTFSTWFSCEQLRPRDPRANGQRKAKRTRRRSSRPLQFTGPSKASKGCPGPRSPRHPGAPCALVARLPSGRRRQAR